MTIDTHINPSAGCVLILKSDLSFSAGLFGWVVAKIDGNIVFEGNAIHFAPTHPARLSIFDPRRAMLSPIYPEKTDPPTRRIRQSPAESSALVSVVRGEQQSL
jgi:hypothetical protein